MGCLGRAKDTIGDSATTTATSRATATGTTPLAQARLSGKWRAPPLPLTPSPGPQAEAASHWDGGP